MSEFIGAATRGYKTASQYETALLGGVFHSADQDFAAAEPRSELTSARVVYRLVKNASNANITPGYGVKLFASSENLYDVAPIAAADEIGCGIADPSISGVILPGERFYIITKGPVNVIAGAAVSAHATIGFDSTGRSVTNDRSTVAKLAGAFGRILVAAGAANQSRRAIVDFRTL